MTALSEVDTSEYAMSKQRFPLGEHLAVTEELEAEPLNPEGSRRKISPADVFFRSASDDESGREGSLLCLVYGNLYYVPLDKIKKKTYGGD